MPAHDKLCKQASHSRTHKAYNASSYQRRIVGAEHPNIFDNFFQAGPRLRRAADNAQDQISFLS